MSSPRDSDRGDGQGPIAIGSGRQDAEQSSAGGAYAPNVRPHTNSRAEELRQRALGRLQDAYLGIYADEIDKLQSQVDQLERVRDLQREDIERTRACELCVYGKEWLPCMESVDDAGMPCERCEDIGACACGSCRGGSSWVYYRTPKVAPKASPKTEPSMARPTRRKAKGKRKR